MPNNYQLDKFIDEIYNNNKISSTSTTTTTTTTTTTSTSTTTVITTLTATTTTSIASTFSTTMTINRLELPPIFNFLIIFLSFALFVLLILVICCICYFKRTLRRQVTVQEAVNERVIAREETMYLTAPSSEMTFPQSSIRDSYISAESSRLNEQKLIK
jgi:hypothetical protein